MKISRLRFEGRKIVNRNLKVNIFTVESRTHLQFIIITILLNITLRLQFNKCEGKKSSISYMIQNLLQSPHTLKKELSKKIIKWDGY